MWLARGGSHVTGNDVAWPQVIGSDSEVMSFDRKWRHLTGSHLEAAVEGRKLAYTVHFTSYKAVTRRRRQSRDGNDVTWPQVTGSLPEETSFEQKSSASGSRGPKTGIYCTFHFLQGCSSQEETATWQEMTSRDLRWP